MWLTVNLPFRLMQAVRFLKSSCWSLCYNSSRSTGKSAFEFKHSVDWSFHLIVITVSSNVQDYLFTLAFHPLLKMQEESRQEEELWAAQQGEANQGSCLWIAPPTPHPKKIDEASFFSYISNLPVFADLSQADLNVLPFLRQFLTPQMPSGFLTVTSECILFL